MMLRKLFVLLPFLLLPSLIFAQATAITGIIYDATTKAPLAFVSVTLKGTTNGTVTDMRGNYSIPVENEKQQLVFSFIGLQTSEISLADKSIVDVKLLEDVSYHDKRFWQILNKYLLYN